MAAAMARPSSVDSRPSIRADERRRIGLVRTAGPLRDANWTGTGRAGRGLRSATMTVAAGGATGGGGAGGGTGAGGGAGGAGGGGGFSTTIAGASMGGASGASRP